MLKGALKNEIALHYIHFAVQNYFTTMIYYSIRQIILIFKFLEKKIKIS
jgi:hypothetical protein